MDSRTNTELQAEGRVSVLGIRPDSPLWPLFVTSFFLLSPGVEYVFTTKPKSRMARQRLHLGGQGDLPPPPPSIEQLINQEFNWLCNAVMTLAIAITKVRLVTLLHSWFQAHEWRHFLLSLLSTHTQILNFLFIMYFSDWILHCDWYTLHTASNKSRFPLVQNRVWPCKTNTSISKRHSQGRLTSSVRTW